MSEPDAGAHAVPICATEALIEGGDGVRFPVVTRDGPANGFVVRFEGRAHAYLNRCTHASVELDWERGRFFDSSGLYLMCATHGAVYEPESGRCAGGPCRGQPLRAIAVAERAGTVYWLPDARITALAKPDVSTPARPKSE